MLPTSHHSAHEPKPSALGPAYGIVTRYKVQSCVYILLYDDAAQLRQDEASQNTDASVLFVLSAISLVLRLLGTMYSLVN